MTAELATIESPQVLDSWKSTNAVKSRIVAIDKLMKEILKEGISQDYGRIPGMGKDSQPCLFKAGSEKILAMFQIAVKPDVEDLSTEDCFRFRVITHMTHIPTGNYLGSGVGEASSNETKYKWKRTYSKQEYEATDPDRRQLKWRRNQSGEEYSEMQIRQEPADVANTVLKIAKKRSQVDGTLTVTGASSMFTQDLEDLDEGAAQHEGEQEQPAAKRGRGRPSTKQQQKPVEDVKCAQCGAVNGHLPTCKYHESQKQAKPEVQPPSETAGNKMACVVKSMEKRVSQTGTDYFMLKVIDSQNRDLILYCFHLNAAAEIQQRGIEKPCLFAIQRKSTAKGDYLQLDAIIEIAGVQYVDNKPIGPVTVPATKQEEPW